MVLSCLRVLAGVILPEWRENSGGGDAGLYAAREASLAQPGPLPAAPREKDTQQRLRCEWLVAGPFCSRGARDGGKVALNECEVKAAERDARREVWLRVGFSGQRRAAVFSTAFTFFQPPFFFVYLFVPLFVFPVFSLGRSH